MYPTRALVFLGAALAAPAAAQDTLLSLQTFEQNSWADVSTKHVTVTPVGTVAPAFKPGYQGMGVEFDSVNSLRLALDINRTVHPALTMGGWVKLSTIASVRHFISHDNGGYDRDLCIDTRAGGLGWSCFAGSGVNGYVAPVPDEWMFVAAVYDHAASTTLLYVDGQVRTRAGQPATGNTFVLIGDSPCCDAGIKGVVDNVFFLSEALPVARLDEIRFGGVHQIPPCPLFLMQPLDQVGCPGHTAYLSVDAAGAGTLSYRWRKDGVELVNDGRIFGAHTPTLEVRDARDTDEGVYDCLVTNACASVASSPATVWVCTANFNCDGSVDFFDYLDFVAAFDAEDPAADISGDGIIDFFDYLDFVAALDSGC